MDVNSQSLYDEAGTHVTYQASYFCPQILSFRSISYSMLQPDMKVLPLLIPKNLLDKKKNGITL